MSIVKQNSELYRRKLIDLLNNFEMYLKDGSLREQVLYLVPVNETLRNLGASLVEGKNITSARDRILSYLKKYKGIIVSGDELMVVAGISEYARRVRELRVQYGWKILTGVTLQAMSREEIKYLFETENIKLKPDQYILISDVQDIEAAYRWNVANDIRKQGYSVRDKILKYMREFVGKEVVIDELRYVAGNKTEWARRIRELRTEFGWPIVTHFTGRPDLPVGVYVLEQDRQAPEHDRKIPEKIYRDVLVRDNYTCQDCGWTHEQWNRSDPRHLEAHHIKPHAAGGENTTDNLITLCNICHDVRHKKH